MTQKKRCDVMRFELSISDVKDWLDILEYAIIKLNNLKKPDRRYINSIARMMTKIRQYAYDNFDIAGTTFWDNLFDDFTKLTRK